MALSGAGRQLARESAVQLAYEKEQRGIELAELLAGLTIAADSYTARVLESLDDRTSEIDQIISRYADKWPIDRMPALDRSILRIATTELMTEPDVPTAVVLNEAVELAKNYSTDASARFINGVLASVASELR